MPDRSHLATGLFLSGGVDSLAALYWNVRRYAPGDPRRVRVAFFVHGLDVGDPNKMDRADVWQLGIEKLRALCEEHEVELLPVRVNLRILAKNWRFYANCQFASLLAAIAHAAGARLYRCIVTPDNMLEYLAPHGSHPWLNAYFGADCLEIATGDMEQFSRLQRVRLLADWPGALESLRVCWDTGAIPPGHLNCGRCAKCVRTMLEFLVCGRLLNTRAFPINDVTPPMLRPVHIRAPLEVEFFAELIEPLEALGRHDLARPLRRKLRLFRAERRLGLHRLRPVMKRMLGRK